MDFYHENKEEVQAVETGLLVFQSLVFVACVIAVPFTGGSSAALGVAFLGSAGMANLELALFVGTMALEVADSQMDWHNDPDNTPPYVLNIDNAKRELLEIDLSQNLQELSIALGFDSTTTIDLTDEESLNELSTTLAEIESSTNLNLQGVIRQTQYMMGVSENIKFINRKRREILKRNIDIFNNFKDYYRSSDDNTQKLMINKYLFKKINNNVLVDKSIKDLIDDKTIYNIIDYARCFYFTKGRLNNPEEYFTDKYMIMFFKFRKNKNTKLDPNIPLQNLIIKISGEDITYSEYQYKYIFPFIILCFFLIILIPIFLTFGAHSAYQKNKKHDFVFNENNQINYTSENNLNVPPLIKDNLSLTSDGF